MDISLRIARWAFLPALLAVVVIAALPASAPAATAHDPPTPAAAYEDEGDAPQRGLRAFAKWLGGLVGPDLRERLAERFEAAALEHPARACQRLPDAGLDPSWAERCEQLQNRFEARPLAVRPPGAVCRIVLANPEARPLLVERCEAWVASQGDTERFERIRPQVDPRGIERPRPTRDREEICRRVMADPEANPRLTAACRTWLSGEEMGPAEQRPDRYRICLHALAEPAVDPALAAACDRWLSSLAQGAAPMPGELCRRVLAAEHLPEAFALLAERCDSWVDQLRERGSATHAPFHPH